MKNFEIAKALGLKVICPGEEREVVSAYCGDLLSWVMGRIGSDAAWLTVMTNSNVVAVAVLRDASCVILCDGAQPDEELFARAARENISLYASEESSFSVAAKLAPLIGV
ncbi:MAG: DRTGG domain-containing protein [Eubacteriales bacterium]